MQGIMGKTVRVAKSTNRDLENISGKVVDETQNMLIIGDSERRRMVEKKACVFQFGEEKVPGREILGRAKDRIKKKKRVRKRW